jgi:hypothetical protein
MANERFGPLFHLPGREIRRFGDEFNNSAVDLEWKT